VHHSSFPLAACEFLGRFYEAAYNSKFPKQLKGTCLCITSSEREAACDAQMAKGKPQKQITSGFSEPFANYAAFSAMCINILSSKY
jgi:hypothetical protein